MARDPIDVVYDLLERYITYLPFDAQLDYLARFVRTGQFERIDNPSVPEESFAFGTALEKAVPSLTPDQAEIVAKRLLRRLVQIQIDSKVARELTASLPAMRLRHEVYTKEPNFSGPFKIVIANHGEPIGASELGEFLTLFRDVYLVAADLPEDAYTSARLRGPLASSEFYVARLRETLHTHVENEPAEQLTIERIRKASPLTIWFGGVVTLVVIAAILSGGEVKISGMSCKLNALGDGLKKLKAVFADQPALAKRVARKKNKELPPPA
jgi:hypothetical protein